MRNLLVTLVFCAVLPAVGAERPKNLQPVPEPPPLPAANEFDAALEPQVTIIKRGTDSVEEYRVGGKLYMMKVTTPLGTYHLVDDIGAGEFIRKDGLDPGVRVPQWVLWSW